MKTKELAMKLDKIQAMLVRDFLQEHPDACSLGVKEGRQYKTLGKWLKDTKRSDWMLWVLKRCQYDDATFWVRVSLRCVCETPLGDGRTVLALLEDKRSKNAIEIVKKYLAGNATPEELLAAREAAYAAYAAAYAATYDAARAAQADIIREELGIER